MKLKFRFNKKKIIPNFWDYLKIFLSSLLVFYVLENPIETYFGLAKLSEFWQFTIIFLVVTYIKDLFDLRFGKYQLLD